MKTIHRFSSALSLIAALTSATALAQGSRPVVGVGVGAGTNVGVGIGAGGVPGGIGAAGTARSGVGGGAQGGAFSGGAFGASGEAFESIGMRQERRAGQNNADDHASVMAEARGRAVAKYMASGASGSLSKAETVHAIQAQAMDSREELLADLHARTDASAKAMADVRKSGAKLEGEERANFNAASAEVKATERALKKSMKAAEKADASAWTDARAKLATDYEAHASAVAKAEAASRVGATSTAKPAEKPKG
jgi:hypothetical protein